MIEIRNDFSKGFIVFDVENKYAKCILATKALNPVPKDIN